MISKKLFFVALAGLAFTACDKDDKIEPVAKKPAVEESVAKEPAAEEPTKVDSLKARVWVYTADVYEEYGVEPADECDEDDTLEFKDSGVVIYDENDASTCQYSVEADNVKDAEPVTGTYTLSENALVVNLFDEPTSYTITKLTDTDLWMEYTEDGVVYGERYEARK